MAERNNHGNVHTLNEQKFTPAFMKYLEYRDMFGITYEEFIGFVKIRKKDSTVYLKDYVEQIRKEAR